MLLAGEALLQLPAGQTVGKEVDLTQNQHAEHRIKGGGQQSGAVQLAGEEHQRRREHQRCGIHGTQEGAGLAAVDADAPEAALLVLLIEGLHTEVVHRSAGPEHGVKNGDEEPLEDNMDQQEEGVAGKEADIGVIGLGQQGVQRCAQIVQTVAQPAQRAGNPLGDMGSGGHQQGRNLTHQPHQQGGDPLQQNQQQTAVQQGQQGHGKLPVPVLPPQVGLCVQQGQQQEGEQAQKKEQQPDDRINHTAPPS